MSDLTDDRGADYGHPSDHFTRTVAILGIVFGEKRMCDLTRRDWAVIMQCDKLARFSETLAHEDSQRDIGGYSETWFMAEEPPSAETQRIMAASFGMEPDTTVNLTDRLKPYDTIWPPREGEL